LEEQQAISRLKQGDLGGLEILVRHYQVKAVYAAFLIVRDLKLAEDIVQSTFLQAAQRIHQFDESRPFKAWFLRSVVNAAIKADKQQRRFVPLDHHEDEDNDPLIDWLLDPKPGPLKPLRRRKPTDGGAMNNFRLNNEQRSLCAIFWR
jgi:RNA polymerase sigma-70 factor (ECF subfamily)